MNDAWRGRGSSDRDQARGGRSGGQRGRGGAPRGGGGDRRHAGGRGAPRAGYGGGGGRGRRGPTPTGAREPWVQLSHDPQHPLIWQRSVSHTSPAARPGDLVELYDPDGGLLGSALYAPKSRYALRVLRRDGAPYDRAWLSAALDRALSLRHDFLGIAKDNDAYRVVHGEGDGLPGLIVDRYASLVSLELFTEGWIELLPDILELLEEKLGTTGAVVSADRVACESEGFHFESRSFGQRPRRLIAHEGALRFHIDPEIGHKTGFFCDQRENRKRLAGFCAEAKVLDCCSFTGGFALAAKALGGAAEVTAVEIDERAIAVARKNADLNQTRIKFVQADAFHYMRQMQEQGQRYQVVIADPPKFIRGRAELDEGKRKYRDFNSLALSLVAPGGLLVSCSCSGLISSEELVELIAAGARRGGLAAPQLIGLSGAGGDHPVALDCPESSYLKCAWVRSR